MINRDNLETFTPENIHRLKPLARLGRGEIRRIQWIDDETVAVASRFTLRHYRLDGSVREILMFEDDYRPLYFSADGKFFLIWQGKTTPHVYENTSGEFLTSLSDNIGSFYTYPTSYHATHDGHLLAFFDNLRLYVFDTLTGIQIAGLAQPKIFDILFSDDEQVLLVLTKEKTIYFDYKTSAIVDQTRPDDETRLIDNWLKRPHTQPHSTYRDATWLNEDIRSVLWAGKQTLVAYDAQENVSFWDTDTQQMIERFDGIGTSFLCTNSDGSAFATVNDRRELTVFNRQTGEKHRYAYGQYKTSPQIFNFRADHLLAYSSPPNIVDERHLFTGDKEKSLTFQYSNYLISPDNQYIASTNSDYVGTLRIRHWQTGETIFTKEESVPVMFIEGHLLYGTETRHRWYLRGVITDVTLIKLHLETGKEDLFMTIPEGQCLYYFPDRQWYAIHVIGEGLSIFDTATHRLHSFVAIDDDRPRIEFSPYGRYVLTSYETQQTELWDWENNRLVLSSLSLKGVFSPENRCVALIEKTELVVWNLEENRVQTRFPTDGTVEVQFSPDNRLLLCIEVTKGIMQVWNLQTNLCLATFEGLKLSWQTGNICFHEDFNLLALSQNNGTIALWGIEKGR